MWARLGWAARYRGGRLSDSGFPSTRWKRKPMFDPNSPVRIGAYVFHCGTNIAATVDVKALAEYAASLPHVVVSREYKYMCSEPGQDLIRQDIRDHQLNRIVVASCSPHLHEHTFRTALKVGGLNPYFFHMVNIREQASWVHSDKAQGTKKAKDLVRAADVHHVEEIGIQSTHFQ